MATLVTGGAGFVGSNIVKGLAEAGHRVVCFDLTPADALLRDYLKPWAQNVTFVQGDILNVKDLEQAAAVPSHRQSRPCRGVHPCPAG